MAPPLRRLVLRWMAWATLARVGEDAFHLVGRLVLARLLWPEAFGTFSLAFAVAAGFKLCCQLQLSASLVQRADVSPQVRATAFWSLVGLGAAGALVLLALAGPIAAAVWNPDVGGVLRVLSALVALGGCSAVPRAWLWREFGFRQLTAVSFLAEVIGTTIAVAAAMLRAGVYALALHAVTVEIIELVVLWAVVPWRPHRHWRYGEFLDLVRFGGPLAGRRAVDYLVSYGDRFLVGYALGPSALGLYALAFRLVAGIAQGISAIFERVAFPIFARMEDDLDRSRRGLLEALRGQAMLTFPAVLGVALVAPELVPLVLGGGWVGAIGLVQILAIRVAAGTLAALPRAALTGRGRQWLVFELSVGGAVAYLLGWLAGLPWGSTGVAAGGAAAAMGLAVLSLWMVRREVSIGVGQWIRALLPALIGLSAMALGIGVARLVMAGSAPPGASARLAILILIGAGCYVLPLGPVLAREGRRYFGRSPERRATTGDSR